MFGGQLLSVLAGALGGNGPSGIGMPIPHLPGDPEPVMEEAVIKGFKPTHRNIFGRLADIWLQAQGQKPVYEPRMQERDMKRAFEGFSSDPMAAVSRLNQMGRSDLAIQLWDKISDNNRADSAQKRLNDKFDKEQEDIFNDKIVNMLGAATDQKSYDVWKQRVRSFAAAQGRSLPFELSDTFDPTEIEGYRRGEIPTAKLMQMEAKARLDAARLELQASRVENQNAVGDNLIEHRGRTYEEKVRHNQVTEAQGQARVNQGQQRVNNQNKKTAPRVVKTPNGYMELSPSGITGRIGDQIWRKVAPGKWERVK